MKGRKNFRTIFCESRSVEPSSFEHAFLRETLHPIGKPLALLVLLLRPQLFVDELELIHRIGHTEEFADYILHRNRLIDYALYQIAPWRRIAGIRPSGRKLFAIGNRLNSDQFRDR
jgi:hypothetical protein